jgi:hypothetical protein
VTVPGVVLAANRRAAVLQHRAVATIVSFHSGKVNRLLDRA